ncbi:MAG TPA: hypothetical protein VI977_05165 [archaeon]|nr:hypothetical protein [archaeon]
MKKIFLLAPLLFITVFLLGCTQPVPPDQNPGNSTPCYNPEVKYQEETSTCNDLQSQDLKDFCFSGDAKIKKNAFFCDQIQNEQKKLECHFSVGSPNASLPPCSGGALPGSNPPDQNVPDYNLPGNRSLSPDQNIILQCSSQPAGTQRDNCISNLAKENNNSRLCSFLSIISKNDCIYEIAIKSQDANVCFEISEVNQKNSCLYSIGTAVANFEACKQIQEVSVETIQKRDDCIQKAAITNSNPEYCSWMSASYSVDHYVRDDCYWGVFSSTKDSELCKRLIETKRQQDCFSTVVAEITKIEDCKTLPNDANINNCIKNIAVNEENFLFCNEITDSAMQRACYTKMTEFFDSNSDNALCFAMKSYVDKDNCYNKLAIATSNARYCLNISNTIMPITTNPDEKISVDACLAEIGKTNNDESICAQILHTDPVPWGDCFYSVGIAKNDANICNKVLLPSKMLDCVSKVAVVLNSLGVCSSFPERYYRSYSLYPFDWLCYKNYAIEKDDLFVCNTIKDLNLQGACLDKNSSYH